MELKTKNTYEVKNIICDAKGKVQKIVYENEDLIIKYAKEARSDEQKKNLRKKSEWDEFKKIIDKEFGSFYFNFYNDGLYSLPIQESYKIRFLYLCTYAKYTKNGAYLEHDNHRLMKRTDLEEKLGLSRTEFNRTIRVFLETGLLYADGEYFLINNKLIKRGKLNKEYKEKQYTRVFDKALRELYNNCTPKQHKQLYYLFRLLPYMSKKFNTICQNPTERHDEQVIPLKLSEICKVVGYSVSNAKKFEKDMLKLQMFNQYAMLGIKCGGGMWYKINPRVLYAGTGSDKDGLLDLLATDFSIKIAP